MHDFSAPGVSCSVRYPGPGSHVMSRAVMQMVLEEIKAPGITMAFLKTIPQSQHCISLGVHCLDSRPATGAVYDINTIQIVNVPYTN